MADLFESVFSEKKEKHGSNWTYKNKDNTVGNILEYFVKKKKRKE